MSSKRREQFDDWVLNAPVGAKMTYHQGVSCSGAELAGPAWKAAVAGRVCLFQRRVGPGRFDYLAVRVKPKTGRIMRPWHYDHD